MYSLRSFGFAFVSNFFGLMNFYLNESFACMHVCTACACLVPAEVRIGRHIPWNWIKDGSEPGCRSLGLWSIGPLKSNMCSYMPSLLLSAWTKAVSP